jgi:hypothetical protein
MITIPLGVQVNVPAVCMDDSNRPEQIPTSQWIVKDRPYTIIQFVVMNVQNRIIGVKLAEVALSGCFPYEYYALSRFGILLDFENEAQEAIKKLLEESLSQEPVTT